MNWSFVPVILLAIAVFFLSHALQDFLQSEKKLAPARATWLRIAQIFAAVAVGLTAWQMLSR